MLMDTNGHTLLLIGNNSGKMETYTTTKTQKFISVKKTDVYAMIKKKNGTIYKQEFSYGSTYLSQSSRQLCIPEDAVLIEIFDANGNARNVVINSGDK